MNKTLKKGLVVATAVPTIIAGVNEAVKAAEVSAAYGVSTNKLTSEHGSKLEFDSLKMHGINIGFNMPVDAGFLRGINAGFGYEKSFDGRLTTNAVIKDAGGDIKETYLHDITANAIRYNLGFVVGPQTAGIDHMFILSGDRLDVTKADNFDYLAVQGGTVLTDAHRVDRPKGTYKLNSYDLGYGAQTCLNAGLVDLMLRGTVALGQSKAEGDWKEHTRVGDFTEKTFYLRAGANVEAEMKLGTASPFLGLAGDFTKSLSGKYSQNDKPGQVSNMAYDKATDAQKIRAAIYGGIRVKVF